MKMTLDEHIEHFNRLWEVLWIKETEYGDDRDIKYSVLDYLGMAKWLTELKMYREIIDTAEEKIKDIYGAVIVEGYADIFDQLKEIRRNNND